MTYSQMKNLIIDDPDAFEAEVVLKNGCLFRGFIEIENKEMVRLTEMGNYNTITLILISQIVAITKHY
jgi:hypothetical protein